MRLVRLSVQRVPGIDAPFSLGPFAHDPVLVLGPNGSGKSTTRRALRALLFAEKDYTRGVELDATFQDAKGEITASLRAGKVTWARGNKSAPAPELPIVTRASCFAVGVRDLLDDTGQSEEDLARAVRRQLTGGYDMEALLQGPFAVGALEAKRPFEKVVAERDEVQKLSVELSALSEQEDRLVELRDARDRAREAAREESRLELARKLVAARAAERAAQAGLEAFEGGLAETTERDMETADELARELREAAEQLAQCEAKLEQAQRREERDGGADVELDAGEIERRETELSTLRDLERDLEQARAREVAAVSREEAAAAELAGVPEEEDEDDEQPAGPREVASLARKDLRELDLYFDELERVENQRTALTQQLELLRSRVQPPVRGNPRDGVETLRSWLRAPVPEQLELSPVWSIAGLVLALAGAGLAVTVHPAAAIVAGVGAAAAAIQPMYGASRRSFMRVRESIANAYRNSDLDQPRKWQTQAVEAQLADLEELVRKSEVSDEYRHEADVIEREIVRLVAVTEEQELKAEELRERTGLSLDGGRLARRELVHRLGELRAARSERRQAAAEVQRLRKLVARAAKSLATFLAEAGSTVERAEGELASPALRAAWRRLAETEAERREARRVREEALEQRPSLAARVERTEQRLAEFYAARALERDDRSGLERLAVQRGAFLEARELLAGAERDRRRLEAELGEHAELAELGEATIDERVEAARARAARSSELDQQIGRISHALEAERERDRLGDAEGRLAKAEDELGTKRIELLERAAGGFLLEDVAREYESHSRPDVLARAGSLFADFTSDRYHLQVEGEGEGTRVEFKAKETDSGRRLGLRELSDGTRMQLLLAVRIAFAEEAERGESIPLVLDEAFSLSDSHRFRAMVGAVYDLVGRGRQVLYMSANLHEDQIWKQLAAELEEQAPTVVDMAKARKLASAPTTATDIVVPMAPPVPSSKGKDSRAYAHELGVPMPRPHQPAESLHIYHLLHDDLPLLERLLKHRIETLGQWRASSERGNGPTLCSDANRARRLDARAGVAKAAIERWHVGRGKPVGRVELEQADGVSATRIAEVEELATELEGDPKQLVEALRNKRIKGYRSASIDKLEAWLVGHGHLDGNEPLDPEALHRETLKAAKRFVASGALDAQEVRDLAEALFQQLETNPALAAAAD